MALNRLNRGRLNLGLCKRVSLKVIPFLVYACMCLVGRVFVLMGSFSSVLVRSILGGRLWIALVYV